MDNKSVNIYDRNICIYRDTSKCLNCGLCKETCINRQSMNFGNNPELCVNCGQCVQMCPVRSIKPINEIDKVFKAKKEKKKIIGYIAPATRVAFGDIFGIEYGTNLEDKLVGFLKMIGFDYVYDVSFGADLTIMEEANEFVERVKSNKNLPLITSCCPSWVKYLEQFYPELIPNLSTCLSPIGMMGSILKNYYLKDLNRSDYYLVAITPCISKKYEVNRPNMETDLAITLYELSDYIKENNIKFEDIKEEKIDSLSKTGSGVIFGNTGGVMSSAIRTAYYYLTNKKISLNKLIFKDAIGYNGVRDLSLLINGHKVNFCIVDGLANATKILEDVKLGISPYDFIEIMNCVGGCIGGGGLPKLNVPKEEEIKSNRINSLKKLDNNNSVRYSFENKEIIKLYKEYLIKPGSDISEKELHTTYIDRSIDNKY